MSDPSTEDETLSGNRYRRFLHAALTAHDSEPMPDPREKAWEVARQWLSSSSTEAFFTDLNDEGLMFCWKAPTDD